MRVLLLLLAACAAAGAGCTNFDREDRVEDLRVLAIQTEPAEILYSPLHLIAAADRPPILPLPTTDVTVKVFAYDPRGGRVSTSVQLCPEGAGDATCRLYDQERDVAQEPAAARDELNALLDPTVIESEINLSASTVGRIEPRELDWSFTPAVIDFFIRDNSDGQPVPSIFPLLPRIVVQPTNLTVRDADPAGVVKERAFKRIPVTLDLTSDALPPDVVDDLAQGLGITLCAAPIPEAEHDLQGRAACLAPRLPNNNPALAGFLEQEPEAELPAGTLAAADITPTFDVVDHVVDLGQREPGEVVQLTPLFGPSGDAPNSVERYQVISFDIEASKIIILNRVEDIAVNWYATRGEMTSTLTAEQFTSSLGIAWQLPANAEAGETDTLFAVVLDQRGGTNLAELRVTY